MGQYSYTPTYYSSLHDTITSLCKSFLPFRRGRCLPNPLHKRQTDHLKWQQDSFHRILHLLALRREGIVPDSDVATFRTHLLDTLIAAPSDPEPPSLLRDKLIFLQELLYAGCISRADYHSSKRPLLQRLAVQGVEIDSRDLVIAGNPPDEGEEEEWSEIDLRDKETATPPGKKAERRSPLRPLRSAIALFGGRRSSAAAPAEAADPPRGSCSVLMAGSAKEEPAVAAKKKKKSLHVLFSKEQGSVSGWKHLEGLKRWKRGGSKEEAAVVGMEGGRRSGVVVSCELVASPVREAPDTKRIKATTTMLPAEEFLPKAQGSHRSGVAENQQQRNMANEKPNGGAQKWIEFDNDDGENRHPNLLFSSAISQHKGNHPFSDDAPKIQNKNPFVTSPPRNPFLDEKLNPFNSVAF